MSISVVPQVGSSSSYIGCCQSLSTVVLYGKNMPFFAKPYLKSNYFLYSGMEDYFIRSVGSSECSAIHCRQSVSRQKVVR